MTIILITTSIKNSKKKIPVTAILKKKFRTSFGESRITVSRDCYALFNPIIVPKRGNMANGIENVIVSLYAKGMSNAHIADKIREVYNFNVSTFTTSRITDGTAGDILA